MNNSSRTSGSGLLLLLLLKAIGFGTTTGAAEKQTTELGFVDCSRPASPTFASLSPWSFLLHRSKEEKKKKRTEKSSSWQILGIFRHAWLPEGNFHFEKNPGAQGRRKESPAENPDRRVDDRVERDDRKERERGEQLRNAMGAVRKSRRGGRRKCLS